MVCPLLFTEEYRALQTYLTTLPRTGNANVFQATLGMDEVIKENKQYQAQQVGRNDRVIVPFTLPFALKQIAGETIKDEVINKLQKEFLPEEYRQWLDGDLSAEDLKAMRERLQAEIDKLIGPIAKVMNKLDEYTPEQYKEFEDWVTVISTAKSVMSYSITWVKLRWPPNVFANLNGIDHV